jgi:5-methylcytosine-specific restriction endonuclease McrA
MGCGRVVMPSRGVRRVPVAPRRPCIGMGPRSRRCNNLVSRGDRCCPECLPFLKEKVRVYDVERNKEPGRRFLHSRTWRAIRMAKLSGDPLCERCWAKSKYVAARLVHHKDRDELNNLMENLESLCVECHNLEHPRGRPKDQ